MAIYGIYSQTMDDYSADYGMPPRFVTEATNSDDAARVMRDEVTNDSALAVWAEDEEGRKYYLDKDRGLVSR